MSSITKEKAIHITAEYLLALGPERARSMVELYSKVIDNKTFEKIFEALNKKLEKFLDVPIEEAFIVLSQGPMKVGDLLNNAMTLKRIMPELEKGETNG